jgi:hypothetical protein
MMFSPSSVSSRMMLVEIFRDFRHFLPGLPQGGGGGGELAGFFDLRFHRVVRVGFRALLAALFVALLRKIGIQLLRDLLMSFM